MKTTKKVKKKPQKPNPKWILLASNLLKEAADEFSNHCCNDWDFPKKWTKEEKKEFLHAMYEWDRGTGETDCEDEEEYYATDWLVMDFLAEYIKDSFDI